MRLKPELGIMIKIALAVGTFLTSYGIVHADEVTPPPRGRRRRSGRVWPGRDPAHADYRAGVRLSDGTLITTNSAQADPRFAGRARALDREPVGARRLAAQRCPRRFVPLITENLDRCK
jgi:hypothetical protein